MLKEFMDARCAGCGETLRVPARYQGKTVLCPRCKQDVVVPLDDAPSPGEDLLPSVNPPPPRDVSAGIPDYLRRRPEEDREGRFCQRLSAAFTYPVRNGSGILFLLLMAPLFGFVRAVPLGFFSLILSVLVGGYIAAYLWGILGDSASSDKGPDSPDVTDAYDLVGDFFRFFLSTLVAFAPLAGLWLFGVLGNPDFARTGLYDFLFWLFAAFGIFYYPMTLLLIGFANNLFAPFNYVFAFRSIARIFPNYLVCVLYLAAAFVGASLLEAEVFGAFARTGWGGYVLAGILISISEVYLWALQMRVLGLLYACNKRRLGWFRYRPFPPPPRAASLL